MTVSLRQRFPLRHGNHPHRDAGMCTMEFVSWLAGESHTDHPRCACPVLGSYVRAFNDLLPDSKARDRYLRPIAPRLVNSRGSRELSQERAFLAADAAVRLFAAVHLTRLGRHAEAEELRRLPPITSTAAAAQAAAALAPMGRAVRPARWVAKQAAIERPPELWVTGVVHAAWSSHSWQAARRLLEDMVALGDAPIAAARR